MSGWTVPGVSLVHRGWRTLVFPFLLVLVLVHAVSAQEEYRLSVDQVIVSDDGESLTALVSVLGPAGQPVLDLTAFDASIDSASVPLESLEPVVNEEAGIAVLLVIDVSGSMLGEPLAQARAAAETFVDGLFAQDVAAVMPFAGRAPDEAFFTTDPSALLAQIRALEAEQNSGTALNDAVVNGLANAARAPSARRAVVLLTDGRDSRDVSEHSRDDALLAAATVGLPIYAIGLGEDADVDFLRTLAQDAGGGFFQAPTPADVPAIFDAIGGTLRSQHALTLPLPPAGSTQRELLIRLDLAETTLTARASFQAPAAVIEAGGGGDGPPPWLWAVSALAAVLLSTAGGAILIRRRQQRKSVMTGGRGHNTSLSIRALDPPQAASFLPGRLTVVAGPSAGASVLLASGPIEIGSDPACGLQLDAVDGSVATTHARAWLQASTVIAIVRRRLRLRRTVYSIVSTAGPVSRFIRATTDLNALWMALVVTVQYYAVGLPKPVYASVV